jgi:hypothetical protein
MRHGKSQTTKHFFCHANAKHTALGHGDMPWRYSEHDSRTTPPGRRHSRHGKLKQLTRFTLYSAAQHTRCLGKASVMFSWIAISHREGAGKFLSGMHA